MATLEELSTALVKADAAGNTEDAKAFADAIRQMRSGIPAPRKTGADLIPTEPGANLAPTVAPKQSAMDIARGVIETPAAIAATMLGGPITYLSGVAGPEVQRKVAANIQYQPRTQLAQDVLESIARNPVVEKLPPFMPAMGVSRAAIPAARAVGGAIRNEAELIRESAQAPFAARAERAQQQRVEQSYANAPMIEATQAAQRIGGAVPPAISNPTMSNVVKGKLAGPELQQRLTKNNEAAVTEKVRENLGVKPNEKLIPEIDENTGKINVNSPIARALDEASKPYAPIREIESLAIPKESIDALEMLRKQSPIGGETKTAAINSIIDDALAKLQETTTGPFSGVGGGAVPVGRSGAAVLDDIRSLRRDAQATYRAQKINPDPLATAKADTQMAIAGILEDVIDANASSPKMLDDLKKARARIAQIYEHERAINYGQQKIDPQVYAKLFEERKGGMTGLNADIAKAAAMFPDYFTLTPPEIKGLPRLTRGGVGGAIGGALGAPLGPFGFVAGTATGMGIGSAAGGLAAKRMATPNYQAKYAVPPDYRPPVNNLRPADINYGPNQVTPYQPEVVGPSAGGPANKLRIIGYDQEGRPIYKAEETRPGFTMPQQAPDFGPTVFESQRGLPNEVPRQIYEAQKRAELAQGFRETAERKPAAGEVILDFDPITGRFREASQGIKGATPETFQKLSALDDAAKKVTEGKLFDLTATEKVAWDKAKVDFAEVAPGFKSLTDKAIAQKMMDRKWIEETVTKAREKAAMFDDISKRVAGEQAKRDAAIKRDQMLDVLAALEERLSAPRPVSSGIQGPKTRAAKRNALAPDNQNNLAP
jgi:hypothetical protein